MADSFHSARMSKLCLAHQRRKDAESFVLAVDFPDSYKI